MLNSVHILLSYTCLWQCDHCFLHCSPLSGGTFSFQALEQVLEQSSEMGTVKRIAFEGGEPFLFYPLLVHGIAQAKQLGFETEVVTNGYWALTQGDARQWLRPLVDAGLSILDVSDDAFHHGDTTPSPAKAAYQAALDLGIRAALFTIDPPEIQHPDEEHGKGDPIVGGGVRFRGRAVDTLIQGLPVRDWRSFDECPGEDFIKPRRVHVDAEGNVQLCQGVCIGNLWDTPLVNIMSGYDPSTHPICGPLHKSGPAGLAKEAGLEITDGYVDACHLCYMTRKKTRSVHPDWLSPAQAYGE